MERFLRRITAAKDDVEEPVSMRTEIDGHASSPNTAGGSAQRPTESVLDSVDAMSDEEQVDLQSRPSVTITAVDYIPQTAIFSIDTNTFIDIDENPEQHGTTIDNSKSADSHHSPVGPKGEVVFRNIRKNRPRYLINTIAIS